MNSEHGLPGRQNKLHVYIYITGTEYDKLLCKIREERPLLVFLSRSLWWFVMMRMSLSIRFVQDAFQNGNPFV